MLIFLIYCTNFNKCKTNDCGSIHLASLPILEQGPQNQTVLDGKDATMLCRAVGAPTPNVTWIYNGKKDPTNLSL